MLGHLTPTPAPWGGGALAQLQIVANGPCRGPFATMHDSRRWSSWPSRSLEDSAALALSSRSRTPGRSLLGYPQLAIDRLPNQPAIGRQL